jgi:Methyltransferase domain
VTDLDKLGIYREHFAALPGWFTDDSAAVWDCLLAFQHAQAVRGHAFEIGVFHGKSAALTCLHLRADEQLVLVDPYRLDEVRERLATIRADRLVCHPCLSTQLPAADLQELHGRCRWVHVDGEHTGFACSHDLALADRLLDDRGLVVVDDFLSPRYPQVAAAVFNYLHLHPFSFRLFLCGFFKAYLVRPKHAAAYLEFVRDRIGAELQARGHGQRISFFKTTVPDDYNCFGMGRFEGRDMIGLDWDKDRILV